MQDYAGRTHLAAWPREAMTDYASDRKPAVRARPKPRIRIYRTPTGYFQFYVHCFWNPDAKICLGKVGKRSMEAVVSRALREAHR